MRQMRPMRQDTDVVWLKKGSESTDMILSHDYQRIQQRWRRHLYNMILPQLTNKLYGSEGIDILNSCYYFAIWLIKHTWSWEAIGIFKTNHIMDIFRSYFHFAI